MKAMVILILSMMVASASQAQSPRCNPFVRGAALCLTAALAACAAADRDYPAGPANVYSTSCDKVDVTSILAGTAPVLAMQVAHDMKRRGLDFQTMQASARIASDSSEARNKIVTVAYDIVFSADGSDFLLKKGTFYSGQLHMQPLSMTFYATTFQRANVNGYGREISSENRCVISTPFDQLYLQRNDGSGVKLTVSGVNTDVEGFSPLSSPDERSRFKYAKDRFSWHPDP